jgi:hypothetical protein
MARERGECKDMLKVHRTEKTNDVLHRKMQTDACMYVYTVLHICVCERDTHCSKADEYFVTR